MENIDLYQSIDETEEGHSKVVVIVNRDFIMLLKTGDVVDIIKKIG